MILNPKYEQESIPNISNIVLVSINISNPFIIDKPNSASISQFQIDINKNINLDLQ